MTRGTVTTPPQTAMTLHRVDMDTGPMAGKVVLITGGAGGIGQATALGLATLGARVGITGRDCARRPSRGRPPRRVRQPGSIQNEDENGTDNVVGC